MGLDTVATYDALHAKIVDPSIWPEGDEGVVMRSTVLSGVALATRNVESDAERLRLARDFLGGLAVALGKLTAAV